MMKIFSFIAILLLSLFQPAASFGPGCCCKACYLPGCNPYCLEDEVKQFLNNEGVDASKVNVTWMLSQNPEDALHFAGPLKSE